LSELEKHYAQGKNSTVNEEIEELERGRFLWLSKIKNLVDTLANGFMMLE
jgi:hypothetical protein